MCILWKDMVIKPSHRIHMLSTNENTVVHGRLISPPVAVCFITIVQTVLHVISLHVEGSRANSFIALLAQYNFPCQSVC